MSARTSWKGGYLFSLRHALITVQHMFNNKRPSDTTRCYLCKQIEDLVKLSIGNYVGQKFSTDMTTCGHFPIITEHGNLEQIADLNS